jgi:anti-sigma factor RsiW
MSNTSDRDLPVTEEELHAYADGELAADRRAAVETWLADHLPDRSRVTAWQAQNAAIRARWDAVAREPVGARFDLAGLARLARPARNWTAVAAAAACAAFLIGGSIGWVARGAAAAAPSAVERFTAEAIEAHQLYVVEVRHPVEVAANEEAHLVQWLSRRIGHQLRLPDLSAFGLRLVGGRLLPGPTGASAFFMYEGASGQRYTLYCARPAGPETALRYSASQRFAAVYWSDAEAAYVVAGEAAREEIERIARAAHDQLEGKPAG